MRRKILMAALIAAAAALAIMGRRSGSLAIGEPAPPLRLTGLAGEAVSLSDFRGQVVLLSFWATWCPTCREKMPELDALYKKYRSRGFELLAPSVDVQGRRAVLPFVARQAPAFKVALADTLAMQAYNVRGLPSSFLIGTRGELLQRYVGPVATGALENDILKALERRP